MTANLRCERDGFPLVDIDGDLYCSVEYADGLIGGRGVYQVHDRDGYLVIEFDNGGQLPLTCVCCGGRIHLRAITLEHLEQMLSGRTLEGFRHGEYVGREAPPRRHPILALQFSGEEDLDVRTVQIHLESIRRLRPPEGASGRPASGVWN